LSDQLQANVAAAAAAMQQVESASSDQEEQAALSKKRECEENIETFKKQHDEQRQQIDEIEHQLSLADAKLAQLRSQRDVLKARLRSAEARLQLAEGRPRTRRPRWVLKTAIAGCLLALGVAFPMLLPYRPNGWTRPAPSITDTDNVPLDTEKLPTLPDGIALYMSFEEDMAEQRGDTHHVQDFRRSGDVREENVYFAEDGKVGGALAIQHERLEFPGGLLVGQAEYTAAAWVCQRGRHYFDILSQWDNGRQIQYFSIHHFGTVQCGVWGPDEHGAPKKLAEVKTAGGLVRSGEWSFVVARYREAEPGQGVLDLWVNDSLTASGPFPRTDNHANVCSHIGRLGQRLALLDELTVFHRALSDQEIQQLYQMGLDGISLASEEAPDFPAPNASDAQPTSQMGESTL
jgi:hypothetical protein